MDVEHGQAQVGGGQVEESVEGEGSLRASLSLFRFVAAYRGKLIAGVAAVLASTVLQLAFPFFVGAMVNGTMLNRFEAASGAPPEWFQHLPTVGAVLLTTIVLLLLFAWLGYVLFAEIGERGICDLRTATFENLVQMPMSFYGERRSGELSSRLLTDLAQLQELWIHDLRMLVHYAALALGGLVMLVVTSPYLSGVMLAVAPIVVIVAVFAGRRIRRQATESQDRLAESAVIMGESLTAIQAVKAYANERHEIGRFRAALDGFLPPAIRGARVRGLLFCSILFLIFAMVLVVMLTGSHAVEQGKLTPGKFTSFMFYLAFASSAGGTLAEIYGKLQRSIGSGQRIVDILGGVPEGTVGEEADGQQELPLQLEGEVEFRGVGFHYPNRPEVSVLSDVSLTARPGEKIALVGPSGAGKSTLVALLQRFYDPVAGEIRIDGKPAADYPLRWLRARMALVPQEVLLFGGSIRENIRYGRLDAGEDAILKAAEKAHAREFVEALPEGFETLVGDRGVQLSGGQRQRIALARAILRDPSVLILDEATSSLDTESERLIETALEEFLESRTAFIIAHRLSTVRSADRILVLRDGRVVESGTHEELFEAGGFYRLLCEQQLRGG